MVCLPEDDVFDGTTVPAWRAWVHSCCLNTQWMRICIFMHMMLPVVVLESMTVAPCHSIGRQPSLSLGVSMLQARKKPRSKCPLRRNGNFQCTGTQPSSTEPLQADTHGRPTILFDLNGVLIQARRGSNPADDPAHIPGRLHGFVPRPGLKHLLSLRPFFRLGLYTSATHSTSCQRLQSITETLASDQILQV